MSEVAESKPAAKSARILNPQRIGLAEQLRQDWVVNAEERTTIEEVMDPQYWAHIAAQMLCGERFLASLTEEREPRRLLDQAWASNAVRACLEMGQWNFAMRTIQIDYDSGVEPGFGYNRAFPKPTDWVNTTGVCEDEF